MNKYQINKRPDVIKTLAIAALFSIMFPLSSFAQNTIGDVIKSAGNNVFQPFETFLVAGAYLVGFGLMFTGLMRLKDSGERGSDGIFGDAGLRLLGGIFLIALPDAFGAGIYTLYGSSNLSATWGGQQVGVPDSCIDFSATSNSVPIKCVAQNIATNVVPIFVGAAFILFYIVGTLMAVQSIYSIAVSHSAGQRSFPKGAIGRFVLGCLIANIPHFMNLLQNTLGITNGTIIDSGMDSGSSLLSYSSTASNLGILADYSAVIQNLFIIFIMFGVIAVWRGILHIKAYTDGQQGGSLGSGLTHILGGVLLANAKISVCFMVTTVLGASAGSTFGFC